MDRATELELIEELLELKASKSAFLDETVARNDVQDYASQDRFKAEMKSIFRKLPSAAAHSSELSDAGDFVSCEIAGQPILLTRDKSGKVHAFLNVCRHRGTKLVQDNSGCKHRFVCPYHAWTYANTGELLAAPHFEAGFEGLEKSKLGLAELQCEERFGFVWLVPTHGTDVDIDQHFAEMRDDLDALAMDELVIAAEDTIERSANWKILVEGGIESYHFKIAHRKTIGPYFEDNLSSYRTFGPHMRSILPRATMAELREESRDSWQLRDHANVLYTLFPTSQLLVQQDHIVWIRSNPLGPDRTSMRIATMVPKSETERSDHWEQNQKITRVTLDEDFEIGESIQSTLGSGANQNMLFGRFEGALDQFNRVVEHHLESHATASAN